MTALNVLACIVVLGVLLETVTRWLRPKARRVPLAVSIATIATIAFLAELYANLTLWKQPLFFALAGLLCLGMHSLLIRSRPHSPAMDQNKQSLEELYIALDELRERLEECMAHYMKLTSALRRSRGAVGKDRAIVDASMSKELAKGLDDLQVDVTKAIAILKSTREPVTDQ